MKNINRQLHQLECRCLCVYQWRTGMSLSFGSQITSFGGKPWTWHTRTVEMKKVKNFLIRVTYHYYRSQQTPSKLKNIHISTKIWWNAHSNVMWNVWVLAIMGLQNRLGSYKWTWKGKKWVRVNFLGLILLKTPPSMPLWLMSPSLSLSNPQYVPPDLCVCNFVLEQALSVRALQEMLAKTGQNTEGVSSSLLPTDSLSLSLAHKHGQHLHTQAWIFSLQLLNYKM